MSKSYDDLKRDNERLRAKLMQIANGNWNVKAETRMSFREFARAAANDDEDVESVQPEPTETK